MAYKTTKTELYGGKGTIEFLNIMTEEQMHGMLRIYAQVTLPPHTSIGYHVHHNDAESYYILSGTGIYDDNHEQTIEVKPGMTFFTPDGRGHELVNNTDEPLVMMALVIYDEQK